MFTGSFTALITPFRNGEVDEDALRHLVEWQIEQGADGLVPMGTTGEHPTVTPAEHKRVVEVVVETAARRIPVIAGAGSNNPTEAVKYARHAQEVGADAVLCVAGYYNRPSQEGLFQHFKYLHDATQIPIIVYNIPPRAVVDISPETMGRLAKLDRIAGVKDATMDLARVSVERMHIKKPFSFLSGEDMTAVAYNAMGGDGCISVTANVAPKLCADLQAACRDDDFSLALVLHEQLRALHLALFEEPSPAGVKYAASLMGLCTDEARLPVVPLGKQARANIENAMAALGLV